MLNRRDGSSVGKSTSGAVWVRAITSLVQAIAITVSAVEVVRAEGASSGDVPACQATTTTYESLRRNLQRLVGLDVVSGVPEARIDSGRPADAESWIPRLLERQQAEAARSITLDFDHALAMRLSCSRRGDVACALCAWYDAQALGPRVTVDLWVSGERSMRSASDRVLVDTLQARALSAEATRHAALAARGVAN